MGGEALRPKSIQVQFPLMKCASCGVRDSCAQTVRIVLPITKNTYTIYKKYYVCVFEGGITAALLGALA